MLGLFALGYLAIQCGMGYFFLYLARNGHLKSPLTRFLAIVGMASTAAITNLGPIGLILGLPSIVVTSLIVTLALTPKENV